jgi:hypothetical protein
MPTLEVREERPYRRSTSDEYNQNTSGLDLNFTGGAEDIVEAVEMQEAEDVGSLENGVEELEEVGFMLENGLEEGAVGNLLDLEEEAGNVMDLVDPMAQSVHLFGGETLASQGDLLSEEVQRAVANGVSSSDEESVEGDGADLLFAPDSSDDDELAEELVDREVDFDASESESEEEEEEVQEEFDFMRKQEEKLVSLEDAPLSSASEGEDQRGDRGLEGGDRGDHGPEGGDQVPGSASTSSGEENCSPVIGGESRHPASTNLF